jgi:hypothetical protein
MLVCNYLNENGSSPASGMPGQRYAFHPQRLMAQEGSCPGIGWPPCFRTGLTGIVAGGFNEKFTGGSNAY